MIPSPVPKRHSRTRYEILSVYAPNDLSEVIPRAADFKHRRGAAITYQGPWTFRPGVQAILSVSPDSHAAAGRSLDTHAVHVRRVIDGCSQGASRKSMDSVHWSY